jgi:hypothetical protein
MELYLRKVDHPQARDNYRVILKTETEEFSIGSIGLQTFTSQDTGWTWAIDTVIPLRAHISQGRGTDRRDCMTRFKKAWQDHCREPGWLEEFLAMKRRARR